MYNILFLLTNETKNMQDFMVGLAKELSKRHRVICAETSSKPIFDMFAEFTPNIIFFSPNSDDDVLRRCLALYPNSLVIPLTEGDSSNIDITHWNNTADSNTYSNLGETRHIDVAYLGEPNARDQEFLNQLSQKHRLLVFSDNPWPLSNWVGTYRNIEGKIYNRAKVVFFGAEFNGHDISNALLCGAFCSDNWDYVEDTLDNKDGYGQVSYSVNTYEEAVSDINHILKEVGHNVEL